MVTQEWIFVTRYIFFYFSVACYNSETSLMYVDLGERMTCFNILHKSQQCITNDQSYVCLLMRAQHPKSYKKLFTPDTIESSDSPCINCRCYSRSESLFQHFAQNSTKISRVIFISKIMIDKHIHFCHSKVDEQAQYNVDK